MKESHEFDLLNRWAALPEAEARKLASPETIAALQLVVNLLSDETKPPKTVTSSNFVTTIREMRKVYVDGSRLLGETVLIASDYADQKDHVRAQEIYEGFLSKCPSKFYRDIAKNMLKKIR